MPLHIYHFKTGNSHLLLDYREIILFVVKDRYVHVHSVLPDSPHLVEMSLTELEAGLSPYLFGRVSDTRLAPFGNMRRIEYYTLTLRTGQELTIGKKYRKNLVEKLQSFSNQLAPP